MPVRISRLNTLLFFMLVLVTKLAFASDISTASSQLFATLEDSLKQLHSSNQLTSNQVKELLRSKLIPTSDTKFFTYKVLGKHLEIMTAEQKQQFIDELTKNLISSYASVLVNYKNEKIVIEPPKIQPSGKIASVAVEIIGNTRPVKAVTKWLYNDKLASWHIFDIIIEGISLMQTKQAEISRSISSVGVEATLEKLRQLNSKSAGQ